jgi:hypothetical protein
MMPSSKWISTPFFQTAMGEQLQVERRWDQVIEHQMSKTKMPQKRHHGSLIGSRKVNMYIVAALRSCERLTVPDFWSVGSPSYR